MNRLWPDGVSEEVGWFKEGQTHTRRLTRAHKEHCFGKWEESWGGGVGPVGAHLPHAKQKHSTVVNGIKKRKVYRKLWTGQRREEARREVEEREREN